MWWSSGSGTSRLIGSIRYQAGVQRSVIWFKELVITWGQYLNHSEGESSRSECSGCFTRQPAQFSSSHSLCSSSLLWVFSFYCLSVLVHFLFVLCSYFNLKRLSEVWLQGDWKFVLMSEKKIKWNSEIKRGTQKAKKKKNFCKSVLVMCWVKQQSVWLNGSNQQLLPVGTPDQHFQSLIPIPSLQYWIV